MAVDLSPELPIAVFDSGVGGLTVLHECLVSLPEEDYVYLGDDARFPYGARSRRGAPRPRRAGQPRSCSAAGAKLLVIACNSAASAGQEAAREVAAEAGIEVVAVIEPEAEIAAAAHRDRQGRRARHPGDRAQRRLRSGARARSTAR